MPYADHQKYLEKRREWMKRKRAEDPEWAARKRAQAAAARTPEMHRAIEAVGRAVRSGKLIRPDTCERCGSSGPIEAAHSDYAQPLLVNWLCRPCHRRWDYADPKSR